MKTRGLISILPLVRWTLGSCRPQCGGWVEMQGPEGGALLLSYDSPSRRPLASHTHDTHVFSLIGAPLSEVLCPSPSVSPTASPRTPPKHPQPSKLQWRLQWRLQPRLPSPSHLPPPSVNAGQGSAASPALRTGWVPGGSWSRWDTCLGGVASGTSQGSQACLGQRVVRCVCGRCSSLGPHLLGFPETAENKAKWSGLGFTLGFAVSRSPPL